MWFWKQQKLESLRVSGGFLSFPLGTAAEQSVPNSSKKSLRVFEHKNIPNFELDKFGGEGVHMCSYEYVFTLNCKQLGTTS
jgi:hypothetical protein